MPSLRPHTTTVPDAPSDDAAGQMVDLAFARHYRDVVIPRTEVKAKLRLCTRSEVSQARASARRYLAEQGFPVDASAVAALGAGDEWTYELAVRILALALRDPIDPVLALCSIDQLREECDDQQIETLGKMYEDLEAELDPLGDNKATITQQQLDDLLDAAKKKDAIRLMRFGSRTLASFATSLVDRLSTSPTPK